jgi:ribonuclease HI
MSPIPEIFTDGSCHTQERFGAWAAVILIDGKEVVLSGKQPDTTHNRMEIVAVINSLRYVLNNYKGVKELIIVSDSQYVIGLVSRQAKFNASNYKTKEGNDIRNIDLVKELLQLLSVIKVRFIKIKAHQKATDVVNYNIIVDKLSRQIVREVINNRIK